MPDELSGLMAEARTRVAALGFELADLRLGGARSRPLLQVRIDRPDATPGHGITVEDCAAVSRAFEAWLDEAAVLGPRYILEVSSPGIERPVRFREHWQRFVGRDVNLRIAGRGRVRATIVEVPEGRDVVVLRAAGAAEDWEIPLGDVRDATLAVDWDAAGPAR